MALASSLIWTECEKKWSEFNGSRIMLLYASRGSALQRALGEVCCDSSYLFLLPVAAIYA